MIPPMPAHVAAAFAVFPPSTRGPLEEAHAAVFALADETGAGPLTETLKWGEPTHQTEAAWAGSTIRPGLVGERPDVLFHCQTKSVESSRADFPQAFEHSGNRALILTPDSDPRALAFCLRRALTDHRSKRMARP